MSNLRATRVYKPVRVLIVQSSTTAVLWYSETIFGKPFWATHCYLSPGTWLYSYCISIIPVYYSSSFYQVYSKELAADHVFFLIQTCPFFTQLPPKVEPPALIYCGHNRLFSFSRACPVQNSKILYVHATDAIYLQRYDTRILLHNSRKITRMIRQHTFLVQFQTLIFWARAGVRNAKRYLHVCRRLRKGIHEMFSEPAFWLRLLSLCSRENPVGKIRPKKVCILSVVLRAAWNETGILVQARFFRAWMGMFRIFFSPSILFYSLISGWVSCGILCFGMA